MGGSSIKAKLLYCIGAYKPEQTPHFALITWTRPFAAILRLWQVSRWRDKTCRWAWVRTRLFGLSSFLGGHQRNDHLWCGASSLFWQQQMAGVAQSQTNQNSIWKRQCIWGTGQRWEWAERGESRIVCAVKKHMGFMEKSKKEDAGMGSSKTKGKDNFQTW